VLRAIKILAKQFAGFAGGVVGGIKIMLHEEVERLRSRLVEMKQLLLNCSTSQHGKKPGGKQVLLPG
jgi:hypothetical protein